MTDKEYLIKALDGIDESYTDELIGFITEQDKKKVRRKHIILSLASVCAAAVLATAVISVINALHGGIGVQFTDSDTSGVGNTAYETSDSAPDYIEPSNSADSSVTTPADTDTLASIKLNNSQKQVMIDLCDNYTEAAFVFFNESYEIENIPLLYKDTEYEFQRMLLGAEEIPEDILKKFEEESGQSDDAYTVIRYTGSAVNTIEKLTAERSKYFTDEFISKIDERYGMSRYMWEKDSAVYRFCYVGDGTEPFNDEPRLYVKDYYEREGKAYIKVLCDMTESEGKIDRCYLYYTLSLLEDGGFKLDDFSAESDSGKTFDIIKLYRGGELPDIYLDPTEEPPFPAGRVYKDDEKVPESWIALDSREEGMLKLDEIINADTSQKDPAKAIPALMDKNRLCFETFYQHGDKLIKIDWSKVYGYREVFDNIDEDVFLWEHTYYQFTSTCFKDVQSIYDLMYDTYDRDTVDLFFAERYPPADSITEPLPMLAEKDGDMYCDPTIFPIWSGDPFIARSYIEITESTEDTCTFIWHYADVENNNPPKDGMEFFYYDKTCTARYVDGSWKLDNIIFNNE